MIDAALAYAHNGWHVFPLGYRSKEPASKCGFKDATVDPAQIYRWWLAGPDRNIGVATGEVSGFIVLDVDPRHDGIVTLGKLGPLPTTRAVYTGGDGFHLLFKWPGERVPNSAGKLGPGLDVRGDGGYTVAPPSVHPSGGAYRWANEAVPIADLPHHLLPLFCPPPVVPRPLAPRSRAHGAGTTYGQNALRSEMEALALVGVGSRNSRLNDAALKMGQLVAGGELPIELVEKGLLDAGTACGLPEREAVATIASGLRAGLNQPRSK